MVKPAHREVLVTNNVTVIGSQEEEPDVEEEEPGEQVPLLREHHPEPEHEHDSEEEVSWGLVNAE